MMHLSQGKHTAIACLVLLCGCRTPIQYAIWSDYEGPQELWPRGVGAFVDRTKGGFPIYWNTAPSAPYILLGIVRTSFGRDEAVAEAAKHGATGMIYVDQTQMPSGNQIATVTRYKAIRTGPEAIAVRRRILRSAVEAIDQHPEGMTLSLGEGPRFLSPRECADLRLNVLRQIQELSTSQP